MAEERVVLVERRDQIMIITLNRPEKYNAMNGEVYELLYQAIREYTKDDNLRCAIITGAGGNFTSGGDLKWFAQMREEHGEEWRFDFPAYKALEKCKKPVIAAIDGYCLASGFNLANIYCDFRIATERAKFGIPAGKRGLSVSYPIPWTWNMSLGNALYLVLTGRFVSAEEAMRMGFVSEVVPNDKLLDRAIELAQMICEAAPVHLQAHKEFLKRFVEAPGLGQRLIDLIMEPVKKLNDGAEGRKAFLEKRKADFKGQ